MIKFFAALFIKFISSIAAELILTLSTPLTSIVSISFIDLMPPPTVNGINMFFAVSFINLSKLFVPYNVATLSK